MLKPFLLVSALVLLPAIAPGPAAAPPAGQDTATAKPSAYMLEKAKKTYGVDCAMCHGDNGNGKTEKQLFEIIRNGKDKMPPEADSRAKDDEVRALINYVRNFSKGQSAPADTPPATPADTAPAAPATDKPSN